MFINACLIILSFLITGLIYFFTGIYSNGWWYFAAPPLLIAFYLAGVATWLLILYLGGFFVKKDPNYVYKPSRFAQWIVSQTAWVILVVLRVKVHASGFGKIPSGTPVVLIHNHLSVFDEFALVSSFKKPIVFISKPSNFRLPIAGAWMRYAGYISIVQDDIASGTEVIRKATTYLTEKKMSVCIAPEGTRNKTFPNPLILPFKPGALRLATDSGKPVVVAALQNTNAVTFRFPKKTHIYLDIVSVVEKDEFQTMTAKELAERCRNDILRRFEQKEARFYHLPAHEEEKEEESAS